MKLFFSFSYQHPYQFQGAGQGNQGDYPEHERYFAISPVVAIGAVTGECHTLAELVA
jgi:hypothetical protein